MNATANATKKPEQQHEQQVADRKTAREDSVRKYAKSKFKFPERVTRIDVSNVYGDKFRVNFYAEVESEESIFTSKRLVGSEFLNMPEAKKS